MENRWQEFNSIIDDDNLDVKEKGLLLILFRYINNKTGYADPSRELLKKLYGTKKNDVLDKVINSLMYKGYLVRKSGKGIRSKYFIKVGTQIEPSTNIELSTNIEPTVGTQIEPQKEKKRKEKKNTSLSKDIEDIWTLYPNKKGKSKAIKKIEKLLQKVSKDELTRAVKRYADETKNTDKQYIKHGDTFFNGAIEDYLDNNYQDDSNSSRRGEIKIVSGEEFLKSLYE